MKLFKNVGIEDLKSILDNGILPISVTENYNWNVGKRADNSEEIVYLFNPLHKYNSFIKYGFVLLEVEVENASINELAINDANLNAYEEYIIEDVKKEEIKKIYIPNIFKARVKEMISEDVFNRITWVDMKSTSYDGDDELAETSKDDLKLFGETATLETIGFNYFRGEKNNRMLDLYDIEYLI